MTSDGALRAKDIFGMGLEGGGGRDPRVPRGRGTRKRIREVDLWDTWFSPKPSCIHLARGTVILLKRNPKRKAVFTATGSLARTLGNFKFLTEAFALWMVHLVLKD